MGTTQRNGLPAVTLRTATETEADLLALAALFRDTVLVNAPQHYTVAQTAAWAAVAVDDTGIVGFAGIGEGGYVASVYVRHDCLRRGIGSTLMQTVLDHAQREGLQRLYSEASEFSLGLFIEFGFRQYGTEVVDRNGVQFTRYLMERVLVDGLNQNEATL